MSNYTRQQPESDLRARMKRELAAIPNVHAEKIQQVGIRGTADWHVCAGGHFVALESKRKKSLKPDPLQAHKMRKVKKSGGYSFKVTPQNWHLVKKKIKKLASNPVPRIAF